MYPATCPASVATCPAGPVSVSFVAARSVSCEHRELAAPKVALHSAARAVTLDV